jgi:pyridoxine 4-dehydrogenase
VLDNGVAAACAQYDIPLVAYSPLGRGMLTGKFKKFEDFPQDSLLLQFGFPRFQQANFEKNVQLVEKAEQLAKKKGCTTAQLAINWTRSLSRRPGLPTIIPIPGATTEERVLENSKVIDFTDEELAEIDEILANFKTAGDRYPAIFESDT